MLVRIQQWAPLGSGYPESGRGSIPQGRCVRLAVQWFKLSFISLSMGSAGKDKAPTPVRLRKEGSRNQTTEIGTVYSGWHRNYKLVKYGCTKRGSGGRIER